MEKSFNLIKIKKGVYSLVFDLVGEKINKLTEKIIGELDIQLTDLKDRSDIKLLYFKSGKKNNFIAGADINEIAFIKEENEAKKLCSRGLEMLSKLEDLPFPTIAVIDGACLGGGLEFALACTYRVCTDNVATKIGLPEVNLGIFPGLGGTQRLPKLIGLQKSLMLILPGKIVNGVKAFRLKVVDACFHREYLDDSLENFSEKILKSPKSIVAKRKNRSLKNLFLENTSYGRSLVFKTAKKNILKSTKGFYPAPLIALEVIKKTYTKSLKSGLKIETQEFAKIAITDISKNLIRLFFISEKIKKDTGVPDNVKVKKTHLEKGAVLGSGVMGSGIAWLFSKNNIDVILKDLDFKNIAKGLKICSSYFKFFLKTRKLSQREIDLKMLKITGQTNFNGFKNTNIVIEAVFEDLNVKSKTLQELEKYVSDSTIIASNTSSLSITKMGEGLSNPERFIGMHFFNTPNRMPLVEVIAGENTSQQTIASAVEIIKKLKKTPIVVKDSPGFIVNRILLPYINEGLFLLELGVDINRVDSIMVKFGMPMGPFELADLVGLDIAFKVSEIFENAFGEVAKPSKIIEVLESEKSLLGKKVGKGFYLYNGKNKEPNVKVPELVSKYNSENNNSTVQISDKEIENILIFRMINESFNCLEEGIVESAEYVDMAMILGAGFPPFRGGVLRYADSVGLKNVVSELKNFESKYGIRFSPSKLLITMVEENKKVSS